VNPAQQAAHSKHTACVDTGGFLATQIIAAAQLTAALVSPRHCEVLRSGNLNAPQIRRT
jgi:hypothetical protein